MKKSLNEKRDGFNLRELLNKAREIIHFIEQAHKSGFAAHDVEQALSVERPYAKVNTTLAKILGLTQSVNSLKQTHRKMSETVSAFWSSQPMPPAEEEAAVMVCRADGKGVPIRRQGEGSAQNNLNPLCSPAKEEESGKKVSLVGAAYTVDPTIRTPEQVLEALFRESDMDSESPPSRPKPRFKRIRDSLVARGGAHLKAFL
jgi:hypothetical protein